MDSGITNGTLSNGMDYYVQRNTKPENRIQLRLVVNAGSLMEEDDQLGVAHLVEHMAFNGSENFSKNEVIEFFESTGMAFGHDLNAYTSFEQTVYMLECPADDPEIFKTSMQILADWAHAVSFDPEEIEKERGVVIEEWRTTSQGINGRLSNFRINDMLKDSKHSERLPIGKPEVIKNITREEIINFYKKWYRPDLMSVVVVGDKKVSELEKVIVDTMNQIPTAEKKQILPKYNIPVQTEQRISRFVDKEQKHPIIYFIQQKTENLSCSTEEVLKENLVYGIINSIVNFNTITLSIIYMILLLLGLKNKKSKYYIGCIMGGLAIYIAGLAFIYCFKFTEYEAVKLASYSRYISIYMVAVLFVIAAVIVNQKEKTIPLLIILLFVPYNSLLGIRYTVGESVAFRKPYESAIDTIDEKIDNDDKVYIISQNTSGYDYWVLRYTLRPNMINEASTWSIGTKYGEGDIWTKEFTQEEWMDKLVEEDYDFVYLYKCDNQFKDEFQNLFIDASDIEDRTLYKVETKSRKLELVE
jgi:hypothetical protein